MRALVVLDAATLPERRGILRALRGHGADLTVAVNAAPGAPLPEEPGLHVVAIPSRGDGGEARWQRSALQRLLMERRPAVVQVEAEPWTPMAAQVIGLAAKLRLPAVLAARTSIAPRLSFFERQRRSGVLKAARGLIGINGAALALLDDAPATAARLVLRLAPADAPAVVEPPPADRLFTIGFIGRLLPERGLDLLLRGAARLRGDWRLLVAGTGPAQEELERLAERLGMAARVSWLGGIPAGGLGALWPSLDCLVLPARSTPQWVEPTAQAALDAMARGIPVIGTECGAIPEAIGDAGIVIGEDDADALGLALERLQAMPDERVRLGLAGRRRVMNEFVEEALARRNLALWEQVSA